jgi:glycosyltransferase involved in cell wall biosynthesis
LNGTENVEKGISSKLYEYQAAGKPIICCSRGTSGRYVAETKSGIVVNPGDYVALAAAVLELYRDAEACSRFGKNGRRYVEENLSLDNVSANLLCVFQRTSNNLLS